MQQRLDQRLAIYVITFLLASDSIGWPQIVPLPRARPGTLQSEPISNAAASSCQLRLAGLAVFTPSAPIGGPGECMASDVVELTAVLLSDKRRIVLSPAATLQCPMAETVAEWITQDVAPVIAGLGMSLSSVETLESFGCRPRNGVAGAQVSEHGHANALDMRAFRLSNGEILELTNAGVNKPLRERLRDSACMHFSTVLGNGADAFHDTHVHLDLMDRKNHYKICQWDVRDAAHGPSPDAETAPFIRKEIDRLKPVPLPRPRPRYL